MEENKVDMLEKETAEEEALIEMSMPDFWKKVKQTPVREYPKMMSILMGARAMMLNASQQAEHEIAGMMDTTWIKADNKDFTANVSMLLSVMNKVTIIDTKISVIKWFDYYKTPDVFKNKQ